MPIVLDGTSGITTPDLTDSSLTANRVVYAGTGGNLTGASTFVFDGSNLGVGTSSPTNILDVSKNQNSETSIGLSNTNVNATAQVRTKYTTDSGLFTVGKASSLLSPASGGAGSAYLWNVSNTNMLFATNDTLRLTLDNAGNLGLGSTPNTWGSSKAIQIGAAATFSGQTGAKTAEVTSNAYLNSGWKYLTSGDKATLYYQYNGAHTFNATTATGTAGNAITWDSGTVINPYGIGIGGATPSSGIGISFPATQSASSDANTLDDYEEGTWTPTYRFSVSGNASTVSYGTYVKVGSSVFVQCYVYINSSTAVSGDATITGFPFASFNSAGLYYGFAIGMARRFATDMPNLKVQMFNNATIVNLTKNATNGASETPLTNTDFNVQAEYNILYFSGTYRSAN